MKSIVKVKPTANRMKRLSLLDLDARRHLASDPAKEKGVHADTPCVCTSPLTTPYVTVREGGGPQPLCFCNEDSTVSKQVNDKPGGNLFG